MPLPRPLQGATPPAPFPAAAGGAAAFSTPAIVPPAVIVSPDVQPLLVSENDATALWSVRKPVTTIGSEPSNDVVVTGDVGVAPKHAEIRFESSGYVVYDLSSPTGTFVNDRRVQGRNLLKDGFRVKLGNTTLLFRDST
ncbi:MAG: FHA domain-containing protein [Anaerolineae bacterium]